MNPVNLAVNHGNVGGELRERAENSASLAANPASLAENPASLTESSASLTESSASVAESARETRCILDSLSNEL